VYGEVYRGITVDTMVRELNEKKADEFPKTKIDRHSLRWIYKMCPTNMDKSETVRETVMDAT